MSTLWSIKNIIKTSASDADIPSACSKFSFSSTSNVCLMYSFSADVERVLDRKLITYIHQSELWLKLYLCLP